MPMVYFSELEQMFQKFIWNQKRPQVATAILKEKNRVGGIMQPFIKLYYKNIEIKMMCYWYKNRHIDQWSRTDNPEMNPCLYSQLIFDKGGKNIQ